MRRSLASVLFALGVAAAATACTPMRWEHPQLGLANVEADTEECDSLAWRESWRYGNGFGAWSYPRYYRTRDGRLLYYPTYPWGWGPRNDAFFEEMRLRDYCMRAKGYRAVPVPG